MANGKELSQETGQQEALREKYEEYIKDCRERPIGIPDEEPMDFDSWCSLKNAEKEIEEIKKSVQNKHD